MTFKGWAEPVSGCYHICPEAALSSSLALIIDNGSLVQFSRPVVSNEGQGSAVCLEPNGAIWILSDINVVPLIKLIFCVILRQIKPESTVTVEGESRGEIISNVSRAPK